MSVSANQHFFFARNRSDGSRKGSKQKEMLMISNNPKALSALFTF